MKFASEMLKRLRKSVTSNFLQVVQMTTSKKEMMPLGRWKINYCNNVINRKIYLANQDHCGSCGDLEDEIHKK
jgi:hypothetical protein